MRRETSRTRARSASDYLLVIHSMHEDKMIPRSDVVVAVEREIGAERRTGEEDEVPRDGPCAAKPTLAKSRWL